MLKHIELVEVLPVLLIAAPLLLLAGLLVKALVT
jgi:hypothetical protein